MILELPVIFLLPTQLDSDELHELEEKIPTLTYDINEAEVILGKVSRKQRALFELRKLKLHTEEVDPAEQRSRDASRSPPARPAKRIRLSTPAAAGGSSDIDSDTASEAEIQRRLEGPVASITTSPATIKVVKLAWLTDCLEAKKLLPLEEYIVYEGRKLCSSSSSSSPAPVSSRPSTPQTTPGKTGEEILRRAISDAPSFRPGSSHRYKSSYSSTSSQHRRDRPHPLSKPPALLHQTTSEHDIDANLPPIPCFLSTTYSCQRPTPPDPPNSDFIQQLLKIRTARTLQGDKIGVRAYSSAIATVAAYPHPFQSPQEVARLPGCGTKIALLFQEFRESGVVSEAYQGEADPQLRVLSLFYNIWGVAETTAREFYNRGWRDLDDVVEHGWDGLTRVQQIGVKFYDEFLEKIPRREVEQIADKILEHANGIEEGWEMVVVGGYRRGKAESGDVDVVLSHRDERATDRFVERIVLSLEGEGWITHTLSISTANSERGQVPVAWKGDDRSSRRGVGFDTLDKALVVWQDPRWDKGKGKGGKKKRNENLHRRVDIIISPWKTAGCAVLGWTSGTTFQRDLRRYCKKEKGLKFDSSGIRNRRDGRWVDLESDERGMPAPSMEVAEKRVFEGLGLEWREPRERCTW
ncbi:hypothetical protein QBC42DRAFT_348539 [Cladorrhinum samala]|uniref:DNA polymerase n=1 Tax=Cladorrhinum samala TaxID=585594 RepID=A0AAV9HGY4_9PEZI|nr:hypothetical protein QBC42DRAFT_348539 [Cladorrhinum samala]